ncbi:hypothetical protein H3U94_00010 [Bartonella sp. W8125]|uniref:hypothetical protein n=1 Tax=Bartonella TaxID=773 RepID=UPI0018DE5710|nr:hypothetical protein [Bartonella choladocola]MBI0139255.1 hypothetical protein [Bartonella choladocola]
MALAQFEAAFTAHRPIKNSRYIAGNRKMIFHSSTIGQMTNFSLPVCGTVPATTPE